MNSKEVNIKCPVCDNPIVTAYQGKVVKGILQHKCGKCKRYWNVDYTNKTIVWVKGKESCTPIREFQLDLATGTSIPIAHENTDKALLRRKGA